MEPSKLETSSLGDRHEDDDNGTTLEDLPEHLLAKSLLGLEPPFSLRRVCKQLRRLFDESCTQLRIQHAQYLMASGSAFQYGTLLCLLRRLPRLSTLMDLDPRRGLNLPWVEMGQILGGQLTRLVYHCNWRLRFLEQLSSLRSLELRRGGASQHMLELQPLSALHGLEHLSLNDLPVRDIGPLTGCSRLQTLELSGCPIRDLGPLRGFYQLQFLDLCGCPIKDLEPLAQCADLRTLKLSHHTMRDLGPLGACVSLQHLDLGGCRSITRLEPLEQCTNLRHLNLSSAMASDFDFLASCTGLQHLNLSFCVHLRSLSPLVCCPNLQHLDISVNTIFTLEPLWGLQKLQYLDLRGTRAARLGDGIEGPRPELGPLTRVKDLLLEFSEEAR